MALYFFLSKIFAIWEIVVEIKIESCQSVVRGIFTVVLFMIVSPFGVKHNKMIMKRTVKV